MVITPASSLAYEAAARDSLALAAFWEARRGEPGAEACAASCRRAAEADMERARQVAAGEEHSTTRRRRSGVQPVTAPAAAPRAAPERELAEGLGVHYGRRYGGASGYGERR